MTETAYLLNLIDRKRAALGSGADDLDGAIEAARAGCESVTNEINQNHQNHHNERTEPCSRKQLA